MSKKQDGGPAFPTLNGTKYDSGMTLRDWFAGQALAGIKAYPETTGEQIFVAEICYEIADEMLEARKNNK